VIRNNTVSDGRLRGATVWLLVVGSQIQVLPGGRRSMATQTCTLRFEWHRRDTAESWFRNSVSVHTTTSRPDRGGVHGRTGATRLQLTTLCECRSTTRTTLATRVL
jgi:hypothetical protein